MTQLKAILVDDERLARVNLIKLLESFPSISIVGEADTCATAIQQILQHRPQIIFLDIQLIGETGFDILDEIDSAIKVVFVTAFDQYAIRAFDVNAVDYLLKPVQPDRLRETVERLLTENGSEPARLTKFNYTDAVYVKLDSNTSKFISISSIVSITPVGNYTKLVVKDDKNCIVLKPLKQWEMDLPLDKFVRIHRSAIVNIECIHHIEKYATSYHRLYLNDIDEPMEISRRYWQNLKNIYEA